MTSQFSCIYNGVMLFSYDYNQSLGYLTGIANRSLSNMLAIKFREANINMTAEQWGAIIVLLNDGEMSQRELGDKLHLEKSSVSRLSGGLEKRGWISRTKNPKDSRQNLISPTSKAFEVAEHCASIARPILTDAQSGMSEKEILLLRSLLSRIITNLRV